mgnify:FL=1
MKHVFSSFIIGVLALTLVMSPLATFAKEKSEKSNKSNGTKQEKVERMNTSTSSRSATEDADDDSDSKNRSTGRSESRKESFGACFKAFGHLIAPGWTRKNGVPNVDENCWLPFGINKKFHGNNASTTPDVTAPVISNITFNTAQTQSEVRWTTNENSNSIVFWNTSSSVDTSDTAANRITKNDYTKNHRIILKNLTSNTTYYVVVKSKDAAGNSSLSSVTSFVTKTPSADTQVPVISNVVTLIGTSTIQVGWKTNEVTTDRVYYSTILPVVLNASTTSFVSNASSTKTHLLSLTGLNANTTYYIVIESTDTAGNVTTSATFSAHTGSVIIPADVTPPVISSIVTTPGASTTTISWTTDELSTSKVFYSTINPLDVGASTTLSILNSGLVTTHSIDITGLATSTQYYFKVQSVDGAGNTATSAQVTASTTSGM